MITAKIIQDSMNSVNDVRITTFELEYPRFIHSEFMTHRVFSRNAASSRAIPIAKMKEQVLNSPASPVHWGANQAGMQAGAEHSNVDLCTETWNKAAKSAVLSAIELQQLGLHKQIVNRVLEPFQTMKTVVTATDWDNFFMLRDHTDAQPEIQALARAMKVAMESSEPLAIVAKEWHVPYVERRLRNGDVSYWSGKQELTVEEALKVSASCCAQVSYRLLDDSLEKALFVYDKLVTSQPVHASPFEHQGQVILVMKDSDYSGNLRGFKQYRKIIEV